MGAPKKEHQDAASKWAEQHGGFTKGFSAALLKTFGDCDLEGFRPEFHPDAWKIHQNEGGGPPDVIILEVQSTNPISEAKMVKIVELWQILDCIGSDLILLVMDRTFQIKEVDVMAHYYAMIQQDNAEVSQNKKNFSLKWVETT